VFKIRKNSRILRNFKNS